MCPFLLLTGRQGQALLGYLCSQGQNKGAPGPCPGALGEPRRPECWQEWGTQGLCVAGALARRSPVAVTQQQGPSTVGGATLGMPPPATGAGPPPTPSIGCGRNTWAPLLPLREPALSSFLPIGFRFCSFPSTSGDFREQNKSRVTLALSKMGSPGPGGDPSSPAAQPLEGRRRPGAWPV